MKLVKIIKLCSKILTRAERKLSKKYGESGWRITSHKDLQDLRTILTAMDRFIYDTTGAVTFRGFRYFEFHVD